MAFAGAASWLLGVPLSIPMILGGAFGGALPDVDIEGSSVEKLGTKMASGATRATVTLSKATGGALYGITKFFNSILGALGKVINFLILKPLCKGWRWLSEHVFGALYLKMYGAFGKNLGWDSQKPWVHRGGLTHSLIFMILALTLLLPISLLIGSWDFLIGTELGILSHLLADAVCRSGVKFFWPWLPKIGFPRVSPDGKESDVGRGIRLLPFKWLVKTGCDSLTDDEIEIKNSPEERRELKKLRRREKTWQAAFQFLAIAFILLVIAGVGPAVGGVAWANWPLAGQQEQQQQSSQDNQQSQSANVNQGQQAIPENTEQVDPNALGTNGVMPVERQTSGNMIGQTVPEVKGPTSLTYGDLSIEELPAGIMKMPDESLWIVGVGPVTAENLNNPRWSFTDAEKSKLLVAAGAGKVNQLPDWLAAGVDGVNGAISDASNAVNNAANETKSKADESKSWFEQILSGEYHWGFIGLTPYTQASE